MCIEMQHFLAKSTSVSAYRDDESIAVVIAKPLSATYARIASNISSDPAEL
jgi:hypothetical protein